MFGIDADIEHLDLIQSVELRDALRQQLRFLNDPERVIAPLTEHLTAVVSGLLSELPEEGHSPFEVRLIDLVDTDTIERIIFSFFDHPHFTELGIFKHIGRQLYLNVCAASNMVPDTEHTKPFVIPSDYKGDVTLYIRNTPFEEYLKKPFTLNVPENIYFEHAHIVGGSGAGKTQFLAQLILNLIDHNDNASLVIVDSHGDLIPKLKTLKRIQNRIIHIDPHSPPSVNLFSVDLFDYLFSGIVGADLTAKQNVFFGFLNRLMQAVPNATMLDLLNVMDDLGPYREVFNTLPPLQKQFFERDFLSKTFIQTREQVRYRIHALIQHSDTSKNP